LSLSLSLSRSLSFSLNRSLALSLSHTHTPAGSLSHSHTHTHSRAQICAVEAHLLGRDSVRPSTKHLRRLLGYRLGGEAPKFGGGCPHLPP
jgi:hypothetical protein